MPRSNTENVGSIVPGTAPVIVFLRILEPSANVATKVKFDKLLERGNYGIEY